ncbi:uncharacterized protein METZ01_LOCUS379801 [marine metagenome]|uniref:Uncharacterized protein n=1 Tax=marine metagenome TaxID=408172 RepID=A0A382TZ22_9ZZZZ
MPKKHLFGERSGHLGEEMVTVFFSWNELDFEPEIKQGSPEDLADSTLGFRDSRGRFS